MGAFPVPILSSAEPEDLDGRQCFIFQNGFTGRDGSLSFPQDKSDVLSGDAVCSVADRAFSSILGNALGSVITAQLPVCLSTRSESSLPTRAGYQETTVLLSLLVKAPLGALPQLNKT